MEQLSKAIHAPKGTQTQVGLVGGLGGGASVSSSGPGTPQKQALSEKNASDAMSDEKDEIGGLTAEATNIGKIMLVPNSDGLTSCL